MRREGSRPADSHCREASCRPASCSLGSVMGDVNDRAGVSMMAGHAPVEALPPGRCLSAPAGPAAPSPRGRGSHGIGVDRPPGARTAPVEAPPPGRCLSAPAGPAAPSPRGRGSRGIGVDRPGARACSGGSPPGRCLSAPAGPAAPSPRGRGSHGTAPTPQPGAHACSCGSPVLGAMPSGLPAHHDKRPEYQSITSLRSIRRHSAWAKLYRAKANRPMPIASSSQPPAGRVCRASRASLRPGGSVGS